MIMYVAKTEEKESAHKLKMMTWATVWTVIYVFKYAQQALYRVNQDGDIENTFVFKIRNKSNQDKYYQIDVTGLENAEIIGHSKVKVLPSELKTSTITVVVDKPLFHTRKDISFNVLEVDGNDSVVKSTSFYSGNGTR